MKIENLTPIKNASLIHFPLLVDLSCKLQRVRSLIDQFKNRLKDVINTSREHTRNRANTN